MPFIPKDASSKVNDDGLSFWDERTLYVEPHLSTMCNRPATVAWWLKKHGELRRKWLPIQAIKTIAPSCAFVVLSGANAKLGSSWERWAGKRLPQNWITMTKAEHNRRTKEYLLVLDNKESGSLAQSVVRRPRNTARKDIGLFPSLVEDISTNAFPAHEHPPNTAKQTTNKSSWASGFSSSSSSDGPISPQDRHKSLVQLANLPSDSSETAIKAFVIGISRRPSTVQSIYYKPGDTTAIIHFTDVEDAELAAQALSGRGFKNASVNSKVEARLMTSFSHVDHAGLVDQSKDGDKGPLEAVMAISNARGGTTKKRRRKRKRPKGCAIDT